jgi:protein-histidine N-methyltransferase
MTLFAHILSQTETVEGAATRRNARFTFADYNDAVLRLVTLPNLLLTWHNSRPQTAVEPAVSQEAPRAEQDEELDITPELVDGFRQDLARRGISIDFISGGWSPEFVDLVFSNPSSENCKTLVLASETIYSPGTLTAFSETLLALLRRSSTPASKTRALVAAKKVYFGVGGGVDEFLAVLKSVCGDELQVQEKLDVQSEGVGRVVLEVISSANGI